jgi:hypothetical protein
VEGTVSVVFSEPVTVKGKPALSLADGKVASYESGSGTAALSFKAQSSSAPTRLNLNGGAINTSSRSGPTSATASSASATGSASGTG